MTNTEAGLLDDIIANPADDVPRLIYADWLEERGEDDRAEFIRVQIKLAQCPDPFDNRELPILYRAPAFLDFPGTEQDDFGWNGTGSTEIEYDSGVKTVFRRGFLAEIHGQLDVLMEHLPRLVRRHPIEAVRVTDKEPFEGIAGILGGGRFVVGWHPLIDPADPRRTNELHRSIFDLLIPGIASRFGRGKYYPTADAAHAALSVALLGWAKAQCDTIPTREGR